MPDFFARLRLPTKPDFDFMRDSGTEQYVPPPVLNNYILQYSNAAIDLTEQLVVRMKDKERTRLELKDKQRFAESIRTALLAANPAPPSSAKNLQLTEAYIQSLAVRDGKKEILDEADRDIAKLETEIDKISSSLESMRFTMDTIKLAITSIQTHLSYIKAEGRLV